MDCGCEATWVGDFVGRSDPFAVKFRQTVDIPLAFVSEVLGEVNYFKIFRGFVFRPEFGTEPMSGTKEDHIDKVEGVFRSEDEVSVPLETGMNFIHTLSGVA